MRRTLAVAATLLAAALAVPSSARAEAEFTLGLGAHYWRTLDDLVDEGFDVEEEGLAPVAAWQYFPGGLVGFEVEVEYFEAGFGGATGDAVAPSVYVLVSAQDGLYGGVGIGVTLSDDFDGNVSDPFYTGRIGFVLGLLPKIGLDINANYRAASFSELEEADTDAITLGASLRIGL
jgi:hypothetical protein